MKSNTAFFIEFLFFDVVAVAFGVWQWWSVRPGRSEKAETPSEAPQTSPEDPGHPKG